MEKCNQMSSRIFDLPESGNLLEFGWNSEVSDLKFKFILLLFLDTWQQLSYFY